MDRSEDSPPHIAPASAPKEAPGISADSIFEASMEELKASNEDLKARNEKLRGKVDELNLANSDLKNFMAASSIATIFVDRALRIKRYTPSAVELFRLTASDVGRSLLDVANQLRYAELEEDIARVLAELRPMKREVANESGRWFLVEIRPYRTAEDQIAGAVISLMDITEAREAEHALRESEERMRLATDAANIFGWEAHGDGPKIRFAPNAERVLGFRPPEDARAMMEMVHPEDRAAVEEQFARALQEKTGIELEFRLIHPETGATLWLSAHALLAAGFDGKERYVGITQNATGRKQGEAELRDSQELLRLIVENARDYAILSMETDRTITSWNAGAEAITGYSAAEVVGQPADLIFTAEDRAAGAPQQEAGTALAEGRATDERWHVRKDGTRFWGSGVMMAMHNPKGESVGLVKIFRDHTAELRSKKALEEALQETEAARAEAEAATKAKDHFLAVLSHELRTPLTPVIVGVEILRRRNDLPEGARDVLDMIRRNIEIEAHFVDDLLDVTRITHGKLEIVRENIDVHEVIAHAVEITRPDAEAKLQAVTLSLDARDTWLRGDKTRLQQTLWNLLKNASKFTPEGGQITVRTRSANGWLVIDVADNGMGIEPESLARIFDPFEQADGSVVREFGGLGLGLAIAKATVDAHGGAIHARSDGLGKGTTLTIELPLTSPPPAAPAP